MTSLFLRNKDNPHYLYGAVPYSDNYKPRNKQTCIAYLDEKINKFRLNKKANIWMSENNFTIEDISNFLRSKGFELSDDSHDLLNEDCENIITDNIEINDNTLLFSINDIKTIDCQHYGLDHYLHYVSDQIGLTKILKEIFPVNYDKILTLAFHQVADHGPDLFSTNFRMDYNYRHNIVEISRRRICEIYRSICINDINKFYESWFSLSIKNKLLTKDIVCTSLYSKKPNMPSLGLLLEESSSLPIFIAKYHGSLLDIKTFCATIDDMPLFSYFNYKVVIDEGFYSAKNINWLLKERLNFLIEIPAQPSNNDYLALNNLTLDISEENILKIGHDFLAYKTLTYDWNYKNKLFVHLFFNKFENTCEICKLLYKTEDMRIKASKNPDKYIDDEEFKKYLDFDENINNKKQIDINVKEEIINSIVHKGRLVLLTNVIDDASSALTVYRNKTVLEEAFNRINNYLELFNLKSEGDFMVEAKLLISFLSLIFVSYTFKKMVNTDLDKKFTIQEVFSELNLVKRVIIKNKIINFPLTGLQKSIFKKLDCPLSF